MEATTSSGLSGVETRVLQATNSSGAGPIRRRKLRAASIALVSMLFLWNASAASAATGTLFAQRYTTFYVGSTASRLTTTLDWTVSGLGYASGKLYGYSRSQSSVAYVAQLCEKMTIFMYSGGGYSSVRPILNWEGPGYQVMFDHYDTAAWISNGTTVGNIFKYRASRCNSNARSASIAATSSYPITWSGSRRVKHVRVYSTAQIRNCGGCAIAVSVSANDTV